MIELGCCDANVSPQACHAYEQRLEKQTGRALGTVEDGLDRLRFRSLPVVAGTDMTVAAVQQTLKDLGFFPGGVVDGICGYRTQSAIRLFQEHVRSVERQDCTPDGRFGPQTQAHLRRWLAGPLRMAWAETITAWRDGRAVGLYGDWLGWLRQWRADTLAHPGPLMQKIAAHRGETATHKPADWDFSPDVVHLVAIRRHELAGRFDDMFLLLIKGLVFTFQGTTEPGRSENPGGAPFLVPGQHRYRFGWHQGKYLALKPAGAGVLVQRTGSPEKLTPPDAGRPLETNATINIHWGGRGELRWIGGWSEGCQTINGTLYGDATGQVQNCSGFAAITPDEPRSAKSHKTRGAYNLLLDLVSALGSDLPDNGLLYTLVDASDLATAPEVLRQHVAAARAALG